MSKPAMAVSYGSTADPKPPKAFKRGDRVRFTGAGREWTGVVIERPWPDGRKSIHPRHDDTTVYVKFDETGITISVSMQQLEKTSDRRRH